MGEIRYDNNSKFNKKKKPIMGFCCNCLEMATFRPTYLKRDGKPMGQVKSLSCTRCLFTTQYNKKGIATKSFLGEAFTYELTLEGRIKRFFLRLYKFLFLGTWNRSRFDFRLLRGK